MAIDPDLLELMPDSVTLYAYSSTDAYGNRTRSATGVPFQCRLMFKTQLMKDDKGRDVVSAGRAILYGDASGVTVESKIELPDGTTPPILSVSGVTDETGLNHHTVVFFGM